MKRITIATEAGNVVLTGTTDNIWSIFSFDSEKAIAIAFDDARKNGASGNITQWIGENSRKELKENTTAEKLWLSVGDKNKISLFGKTVVAVPEKEGSSCIGCCFYRRNDRCHEYAPKGVSVPATCFSNRTIYELAAKEGVE